MGEGDISINKGPGTENKQRLSPEKKEPGTNYIIAIGIDKYKKASLNLPNCVKDCKDVIQAFQTGFQKFEVYKELYDDQALRQTIIDTIDDFCKDATRNSPINNLII